MMETGSRVELHLKHNLIVLVAASWTYEAYICPDG